jgi:CubicO group peptidase (beta-lactamase class C family)
MKHNTIQTFEETIRSQYSNITGIVVQKDGETRYERYFHGFSADNAAHVFSVTKSVFSALIGIAIEQGCIKSVDEKVLAFFPDYKVLQGEETIQNVTIKHLLTMTAPYKYETEPYQQFFTSRNPIQDALDLLGGDKPIGTFHYSAIGGTHILSGILARATGRNPLDYAKEFLFDPLGIRVSKSIVIRSEEEHLAVMSDPNTRGWVVDPQGNNMASWGLFLTPREMAAFGQLYLDGGIWAGEQIVPAAWVAESTREHSRCPDWGKLPYGYLWWVIDSNRFAALGDGGNVIYVNAKKHMVVSIASYMAPDVKDRVKWITTEIEPLFS